MKVKDLKQMLDLYNDEANIVVHEDVTMGHEEFEIIDLNVSNYRTKEVSILITTKDV